VQSLLALWLLRRFELSLEVTGTVFFCTGLLSAFGQLLSAPLARRIGLVRTMVYTHIPANVLLAITPLMPSAPLAVACLLLRMAFAQMDVPARQSLVMSLVPPEERSAAASVTNVPRSLAAALAPLPAGWLFGLSLFGWPLVVAGGLKIAYDLMLLVQFRGLEQRMERR
jgi:predicted MFS family arabinose efflux permease